MSSSLAKWYVLGLFSITSPPHIRRNCPHKDKPGWCAHGVPSGPIVLAAVNVASSSDNNQQVALIQGKVGSNITNVNVDVSIGLDSMASVSVMSPVLLQKLCSVQNNVSFVKRPTTTVNVAGGGVSSIDTYVNLVVQLSVGQHPASSIFY